MTTDEIRLLRQALTAAETHAYLSRWALRHRRRSDRRARRAGRDYGEYAAKTSAELVAAHEHNRARLAECQKQLAAALQQVEGGQHD